MKIQLLTATVCGGKHCKAGAKLDATDSDGRKLIALGKAELLTEKPKADK